MKEKTEIRLLRQLIKEVVEESAKSPIEMGTLEAHGSDYSQSDNLSVYYNLNDTVTIVVRDTAPMSGMNYDSGGQLNKGETAKKTVKASSEEIISALKTIIADKQHLFNQHGKPNERFAWKGVGSGFSVKLCQQALERAKLLVHPPKAPEQP